MHWLVHPGRIRGRAGFDPSLNSAKRMEIIANVLDAFWEVIAEAVEDGDSAKINNYIKMEPRYYKAVKLNANGFNNKKADIVPARYRVRFTMGARLKEACRRLTKEEMKGEEQQDVWYSNKILS